MTPDAMSDRLLLEHIQQCIGRIREYTGGRQATFHDSQMVQDAVVRNLQTLAESTQRLSQAAKATEPAVPWRAISGFRNVLAHNYLGIDPMVVWSVVEKDLPPLDDAIGRMLRTIDAPEGRS